MKRTSWLFLPLLVLLGACGITEPSTPGAAVTTATMASASPGPTEAMGLELRGDGLGTYAFGAAQDDVVAVLEAELGQPTDTFSGVGCELDSESPWVESLNWGDLWVSFSAESTSKSAPRSLSSWSMRLPAELPDQLQLQDGVSLDLTFAELEEQYPTGKMEIVTPGTQDVQVFTLPNEIIFSGVKTPESVMAGEFQLCE